MTQQTICPSCGAPIFDEGNQDVIRCGFCGSELSVHREDDSVRFEILSTPEPQSEVLSEPVTPVDPGYSGESGAIDVPFTSSTAPYETGTGSGTGASFSPPPVSDNPFFDTTPPPPMASSPGWDAPGAQVYPPAQPAAPRQGSSLKWLWIVLAVVLGLCLLCACLAIGGILLFNFNVSP